MVNAESPLQAVLGVPVPKSPVLLWEVLCNVAEIGPVLPGESFLLAV